MVFSILCQQNGGCMGCCGHDFISKEKIKEAIRKNTLEKNHHNPKTKEEFVAFRARSHSQHLRAGVCRNLVEEKGCVLCPLHPTKHEEDLRIGHCDVNYLCKTAKEFETWDETTQMAFLYFIQNKELDNLDYSLKMDNHSLLQEFKEIQNEPIICDSIEQRRSSEDIKTST